MGVPLDPPQAAERNADRPGRPRSCRRASSCARCSSLVIFAMALYLVFLLRRPISWVLIATFLAVALSGPVNVLNQ